MQREEKVEEEELNQERAMAVPDFDIEELNREYKKVVRGVDID